MRQQSGVSVCTNNGPSDPLHLDGGQADQFYNLVMLRSTHLGLGVIKCIYGSDMGEGMVMGVWVQGSTWTNIEIIKVQKHSSEGNYMRYSSDQSLDWAWKLLI